MRSASLPRPQLPGRRRFIDFAVFLIIAGLWIAGASAQTNVLVNGGDNSGTITAAGDGATNFWTVSAEAGDNIVLRLGTTNFTGFLNVYGPDGTLINDGAGGDVPISFTATNDGVFTAVVTSYGPGAGAYTLRLAEMPEPFSVPAMPLVNGSGNPGTLALAGLDIWTVSANVGDNVVLRLGTTNFTGFLSVYEPDGTLLNYGAGGDVPLSFTATNAGAFTVIVSGYGPGGSGPYTLRLAEMPEPFIVPAMPLVNGGDSPGNLALAGLDIWTLTANVGDDIVLRLGTTNFTGFLSVYGPDGTLLNYGAGGDVPISFTATNNGAFTVIVSGYGPGGSGAYGLSLAQLPERFTAPGTPLVNGADNLGTLGLGDLDIWTFTANPGDNIMLRLGTTNFFADLEVYGPDGALLTGGAGNDIAGSFTATNSGTFTAIVSCYGANGVGGYGLRLAEMPEPFVVPAMPLVNGGANPGTLAFAGLDLWTFSANPGDNVMLRLGTTNFFALLTVYGPDGALITAGVGTNVSGSFTATNSGAFTATVSSYGPNGVGAYALRFAQLSEPFGVPGMLLTNGSANPGTLGLGGLDIWTFKASVGNNVMLRLGTTNFFGELNVYGPDGALLTAGVGNDVAGSFTATNSGVFTAIVSTYGSDAGGAYTLRLAEMPEPFIVPAVPLTNGLANLGTLGFGGLDIWTFTANPGDNLVLRLGTTNFYAYLNFYGPDGALLGSTWGNDDLISWTATNGGAYTAIVSSYDTGGVGAYALRLAEMPEPFFAPAMPLISGGENPGTLGFAGLDLWTFNTTAGANLDLQLATTNFYGLLSLYGPNGALLADGWGNDVLLSYTTTNGGAFTAIVDSYDSGEFGAYLLYLGGVPPPAVPSVTTLAGVIQALGVETLNASVTPNAEPTEVYFQWGVTTNYGNVTGTEALNDNLYAAQNVALSISNLAAGTMHYRAVGSNSLGTTYGADVAFTNGGAFTAGTYVFTRSTGLPARIRIQDLLSAAVYDPSGLPDSLASVGPGTNGSSISFNAAYILFSATNNLPESFGYTVTNTAGDSAQGLIQMNVVQPVSQFTLTGTMNPDGSATIVSHGIPGASYVIQRSTDLSNWSDLSPLTAGPDGLLQFTDPTPPTPAAFYRTRQN